VVNGDVLELGPRGSGERRVVALHERQQGRERVGALLRRDARERQRGEAALERVRDLQPRAPFVGRARAARAGEEKRGGDRGRGAQGR